MNTLPKKDKIRLKRGTVIEGKWHRNHYKVVRLLGSGTVGAVYLCSQNGRFVALKISEQSVNMTAEVQLLKTLNQMKVQDSRLGPSLLDVDDWEMPGGQKVSFYVMEYISGESLPTFIQKHGASWVVVLLLGLLEQLDLIHRSGYVFGDLKSENIIVERHPPKIRLIDVGGMTKIGRSVKEYTNFYDRAYWRLGTRRAEPSYDLFSVVMVVLSIFYPNKFTRTTHNHTLIKRKLYQVKPLVPYAPVLMKAIEGKYKSAGQMQNDLRRLLMRRKMKDADEKRGMLYTELWILFMMSSVYFGIYYYLSNI